MYFRYMNSLLTTAALLASPLFSGILSTLLFGRKPRRHQVPGVLFHSVVPTTGTGLSHYPLDQFDRLCTLLQATSFRTICVKDAVDAPCAAADKQCMITFDDGLDSVYYHALPVLESHRFHATIFCLGNFFGELASWDIYANNRHCSREQIRDMSDRGFEIGSHTVSHPCLVYMNDETIKEELLGSKHMLEDITGKEVCSLSFPFGSWNRNIWHIAKECGYTTATLYRGTPYGNERLFPVHGVYRFDSPQDILDKITTENSYSIQLARSTMMSHFAQGTPVWKYRKEYR